MKLSHPALWPNLKLRFPKPKDLETFCLKNYRLRPSELFVRHRNTTNFSEVSKNIPILNQHEFNQIKERISSELINSLGFGGEITDTEYFNVFLSSHSREDNDEEEIISAYCKLGIPEKIELYDQSPAYNFKDTCPMPDGHENVIWLGYKVKKEFEKSKESSIIFRLLGFRFFESEMQWRRSVSVLELKYFLHSVQMLFPKHRQPSPFFYCNSEFSPKRKLSPEQYQEFQLQHVDYFQRVLECNSKEEQERILNSPDFFYSRGNTLLGEAGYFGDKVVTFDEMWEYCKKNTNSTGAVEFCTQVSSIRRGYDEAYERDDDPFTEEEWHNIYNSWEK